MPHIKKEIPNLFGCLLLKKLTTSLIELYLLLYLIIRIFANLYLPYVQTELQGKMTNY